MTGVRSRALTRARPRGRQRGSASVNAGHGQDMRLLPPAGAALGGAWAALNGHAQLAFLGAGLCLAAAWAVAGRARSHPQLRGKASGVVLSILAVACTGSAASIAGLLSLSAAHIPVVKASVELEAAIATRPEPSTTPWGEGKCTALLRPRTITTAGPNGVRLEAGPRARIRAELPCTALAGQYVMGHGRLTPVEGRRESARWSGPALQLSGSGAFSARVVHRIDTALAALLSDRPEHARGLIPGVALGDDTRVSPELEEAMRTTALTHLIAVSGAHVSLVLGIIIMAVGRARPLRTALAGAVGLGGLVILVGPAPSVIRAALMGLVVLVALGMNRRSQAINALSCASIAAALMDPWLATGYGFLLSASATLGIICGGYRLTDYLTRFFPGTLARVIAIPLVAQLSCLPVLLLFTEAGSLWAVPANALVAPVVAPLTIFGLVGALTAPLFPMLAGLAISGAALSTWWIDQVARLLACLPGSGIPLVLAGIGHICAVLALLVVPRLSAAIILVGALAALGLSRWPGSAAIPPNWAAVQCDVGQGSAFLYRVRGYTMMIDVGPRTPAAARCLADAQVSHLDLLILSHFHSDHVEGLRDVLKSTTISAVWISPNSAPKPQSRTALALLDSHSIPVSVVAAGTTLRVEDVPIARILSPQPGARSIPEEANADSLVVLLDAEGVDSPRRSGDNSSAGGISMASGSSLPGGTTQAAQRIVVLGDATAPAQERLVGAVGPVDIAVVAHHGSADQSERLARELAPAIALISVGENSYGHPSARVYELYAGARIYPTLTCGAIAWADGELVSKCAEPVRPPAAQQVSYDMREWSHGSQRTHGRVRRPPLSTGHSHHWCRAGAGRACLGSARAPRSPNTPRGTGCASGRRILRARFPRPPHLALTFRGPPHRRRDRRRAYE